MFTLIITACAYLGPTDCRGTVTLYRSKIPYVTVSECNNDLTEYNRGATFIRLSPELLAKLKAVSTQIAITSECVARAVEQDI